MRIAVTYEGGNVFQHFGKTQSFRIYDAENGTITHAETIGTGGKGHGMLAGFLKGENVDVLICGGIGAGAQEALNEAGIKFYAGVSGNADEAVKSFVEGKLSYDPSPTCDHHEHEHHHHHEGGCNHG